MRIWWPHVSESASEPAIYQYRHRWTTYGVLIMGVMKRSRAPCSKQASATMWGLADWTNQERSTTASMGVSRGPKKQVPRNATDVVSDLYAIRVLPYWCNLSIRKDTVWPYRWRFDHVGWPLNSFIRLRVKKSRGYAWRSVIFYFIIMFILFSRAAREWVRKSWLPYVKRSQSHSCM